MGIVRGGAAILAALALPAGAADFGRQNYIQHCAGCHQFDGTGSRLGNIPDMKGRVGHFLRLPEGRAFLVQVPGTSQAPLSDAQVAQLLNWMLKAFSADQIPPGFEPYTAEEVHRYRTKPLDDVAGTRADLVRRLAGMGYPPD